MGRKTTTTAKHAFSSFIVARESNGDLQARALVRVISKCREMAKALSHEQAPRCTNCDVAFDHAKPPTALAVVLPFAPGQGQSAAAFGICAECVNQAGSNSSDVALEHWRKLWPDMQVLSAGHG